MILPNLWSTLWKKGLKVCGVTKEELRALRCTGLGRDGARP